MIGRNHREVISALGAAAREIVLDTDDPVSRIEGLEPVLEHAVKDPYWLGAPFRRVQGAGSYYLLWRDPETDVSLIAMVLGPAQETPIHDHLTWGVVGVYEGAQQDTRYRLGADSLCETSSLRRRAGSMTYILPPDNDIHFVRSESSNLATISVFFMGSNLGCRPRHVYEMNGRTKTGVAGYANAPCPTESRSPFFVSQFM